MAGKRLLDVAKLLDAGRSISKQHIVLRRQQWEVYSKTSGLAKAVKSQTDRVTVTVGAAYELVKRVNETGPSWQGQSSDRSPPQAASGLGIKQEHDTSFDTTLSSRDGVRATQPSQRPDNVVSTATVEPSVQPDTRRESDADDGTLSSLRKREIQRQAERQIPSSSAISQPTQEPVLDQDVFNERPEAVSQELSSLPRTKIPKHPQDAQESVKHVANSSLNQDVFYVPGKSTETEELPEGANLDGLFSSPRVSRMMDKSGTNSKNPYAARKKLPPKPLPEMVAASERRKREQEDTAQSVQVTSSAAEATPAKGDAEMHSLGESLAQEAEVRRFIAPEFHCWHAF